MKVVAIIPARLASTRFPNKPLADFLGLPMIEHVRRRVLLATTLTDVVVASCDAAIINTVKEFGGKAIFTSDKHVRCTSRVAEAAGQVDADIFVNVQGDEPLVRPEMIDLVVEPMLKSSLECTNLMAVIESEAEFNSVNVVKTVVDRQMNALFFSREPIPSIRLVRHENTKYKQLGIMAFKKKRLLEYNGLAETPLEIAESVDMMRFLENGIPIRMVVCDRKHRVLGVDTPDDRLKALELLRSDDLIAKYHPAYVKG